MTRYYPTKYHSKWEHQYRISMWGIRIKIRKKTRKSGFTIQGLGQSQLRFKEEVLQLEIWHFHVAHMKCFPPLCKVVCWRFHNSRLHGHNITQAAYILVQMQPPFISLNASNRGNRTRPFFLSFLMIHKLKTLCTRKQQSQCVARLRWGSGLISSSLRGSWQCTCFISFNGTLFVISLAQCLHRIIW